MVRKIIQDITVRRTKKTTSVHKPVIHIHHDVSPKIHPLKTSNEFEKEDAIVIEKLRVFTERTNNHEEPEKVHKNGQRFMWILMVVSVIALFFIISSYFSSAAVSVTPKSVNVVASSTVVISGSPQLGLNYQLVTIESETSETILADSKTNVEHKARGKVMLYNNNGTVTQRLISNTRLESTDGRIYRIKESVDIPGYKIVKGVRTPGSAETEVVADVAGVEYNMKISDLKGDFKIYAFKGTEKYDTFYGRISSDILGGLVGVEKIISNDKLAKARNDIAEKLKIDLVNKAESSRPLGYDLLPGSYFIEIQNEDDNNTEVDSYVVKTKSTLRAFLFKNSDLASLIASKKIPNFSNKDDIYIKWEGASGVRIYGKTDKPWEEKTLSMNIFGVAKIIWNYDIDSFRETLLGLSKNDAEKVIKDKFGDSISSITFTIRPGWNSYFPKDGGKIKIEDTIVE